MSEPSSVGRTELSRAFIGTAELNEAISPATKCSRSSAMKSFNKFMILFPDLMQPPLDESQSRICELFGKKDFEYIFGESKGLFFDEKLTILQNFIFNAEKYNQM